ncbi:MAG: hypothetical protein ACI35W_05490 [Anaeroplasmataceae bacterium]
MRYDLKIYQSENGKNYNLVNEFNDTNPLNVLRVYSKALKEYCFRKEYFHLKNARYTRIPYTNIEKITIVYFNCNLYFKYEYRFEDIDNIH